MVCRLCKNDLLDEKSCTVCERATLSVKAISRNLLASRFDGNPEEGLKTAAQQGIRLVRLSMQRLERRMRGGDQYDADDAKEVLKCVTALQKALVESIKIERRIKDQAANMTNEQKCDVMVEFFASLPEYNQKEMLQRMAREYNARAIKSG